MKPRLAVISDYLEEGWPSMDLAADQLTEGLRQAGDCEVVQVRPAMRMRLSRIRAGASARNVDRLINRFLDYPRYVRRHVAGRFDLYHVADHSYAQLVHGLLPQRTGVFCHDLDAFRSLLEPKREPRPAWFRAMMRRVLRGMQKAAVVFYSTDPVRQRIVQFGLLDERRLVHAPYGVSPEYTSEPMEDGLAVRARPPLEAVLASPFLLHVGSCIPRKRIDILLEVFAAVRSRRPEVRLVQVGGEWTPPHREQLKQLRLEPHVTQLRGLTREQIAALYRAAALVMQPSEAEGFGLPVIEALACGAVVVASDIPVLREVGGPAAIYCRVADLSHWVQSIEGLLRGDVAPPPGEERRHWASRYTWQSHAATVLEAYKRLQR